MAYADFIFATPSFLDAFHKAMTSNTDQWVPTRICVSELGDTEPDRLLEEGIAEDLLIKPLSRRFMVTQIDRILKGELRGAEATDENPSEKKEIPSFAGMRVLAADDSPVNREVVSEALRKLDIIAVTACDGQEAVDLVQKEYFDLILMDCSMPDMDGYEATRAIRKWELDNYRSKMPVLALTAHVAGDDEEWKLSGMDDFVTKPFTIGSLVSALEKYLKPVDSKTAEEWRKGRQNENLSSPSTDNIRTADTSTTQKNKPTLEKEPPVGVENVDVSSMDVPEKEENKKTEDKIIDTEPRSKEKTKSVKKEKIDSIPTSKDENNNFVSTKDAFDRSVLDQIREMQTGDSNLVWRMLDLFETHGTEAMLHLMKTFEENDNISLKKSAHALKSISLNVGASELAGICSLIESKAHENADKDTLEGLKEPLRQSFKATLKELPRIRDTFGKSAA